MLGKMARSDPRPSVRVTEVLVAVSTSRLSCKRAGKTRTLMPVWGFIWRISAKTRELGFATMVFRFCDNGIGTFEPISNNGIGTFGAFATMVAKQRQLIKADLIKC